MTMSKEKMDREMNRERDRERCCKAPYTRILAYTYIFSISYFLSPWGGATFMENNALMVPGWDYLRSGTLRKGKKAHRIE